MNKMTKATMMVLGVIVTAIIAASCSTAAPKDFNIAFVVGNGPADSREIKDVVMPGERVSKETDDEVEYVYANARNWANGEGVEAVDWPQNFKAQSKASDDGMVPGYPVQMQMIAYWALNRDEKALEAFYPYCKKYYCDIDTAENPEEQALSTDEGWSNMLYEGMRNVLANAYRDTLAEYDISIVNKPELWNEFAEKMSKRFMEEMTVAAGMNGMDPFCSTDVVNGGKCEPIRIEVQKMFSPEADTILTTRRDQENQKKNQLADIANKREVEAASAALEAEKAANIQKLYAVPGYATERAYQAQLEQIEACNGKCVVNGVGIQLTVPAG
jgi:hypothetical protein